jgi:uncharacterized protein (TIGR04255 family)
MTAIGELSTPERHTYSRAPIVEALIDVRVRLPQTAHIEKLRTVTASMTSKYPKVKAQLQANVSVGIGNQPIFSGTQTQTGWQFISEDEKEAFTARLDGFSYSCQAPYPGWQHFREEAAQLGATYINVTGALDVTRIAVRYINRVVIPLPIADYREYLLTAPEIAPGLSQELQHFVMQLQIPQDDIPDCMLVLNEGSLPSTEPDVAPVLLDIDLFRILSVPASSDEVWSTLEMLHERKNKIFEASITDKARALFR